ncbi:MAG: hypothetical protein AAGA66_17380 [Bacteroidota bacterium]
MSFPDSNASFFPFEYAAKRFFPTKVINELAYDSTIYLLQSFEIDPVQYLSLTATILDGEDSTVIKTPIDSIYLRALAPVVSDTTQLLTNADYISVTRAFNYSLLYIILGAVLILLVVLALVFGKKILKYFKLRKLRKEYETFSQMLTAFIRELKKRPDPDTAEYALNTWKKYQEKLEQFPFTKLTTREILVKEVNQELEKPLKSIDRLIYGKRDTETVYQDFQQIEDFTQHRYNKKVDEIKHGK